MAISFNQTIPILRIFDLAKARELYVSFLGFAVDWEHHFDEGSPAYIQVSRGRLTLHLSEHQGDYCPGSTVFVWMEGIEEFHRAITSRDSRSVARASLMNPSTSVIPRPYITAE